MLNDLLAELRRGLTPRKKQRSRRRPQAIPPQRLISSERLEDRALLSVTWSGGGDGTSWTDPANWAGGGVPSRGQDVILETGHVSVPSGMPINLRSLNIGPGASLTAMGSDVSLGGGNSSIQGGFNVESGAIGVFGPGTTVTISGTTNIDSASLYVRNGATLSLPSVTSYTTDVDGNREFRATDAGSVIRFDALRTITGRSGYDENFHVRSYFGASVQMPVLETVVNGAVNFDASGSITGQEVSRIDLPVLTSFTGYFRYNTGGAISSSGFRVANGGVIHSPKLQAISTGNLSLGAGGVMDTTSLRTFVGRSGTLSISGTTRDFPMLETIQDGQLDVNVDGQVLDTVTNIDHLSIIVDAPDIVVSLPGVASYTMNVDANRQFLAEGVGSVIRLENLQAIFGRTGYDENFYVRAYADGIIQMPRLQTVVRGAVTFDARGTNASMESSRIELPALTSFTGYFRYNTGGAVSSSGLSVTNGGVIYSPQLQSITTGNLILGDGGVMNTSMLETFIGNSGTLSISGATRDLSALTTIQNGQLDVDVDGQLLDTVNNIDHLSIVVDSPDVMVALPNVSSYTMNVDANRQFRAEGRAAAIRLENLQTITGRSGYDENFFVRAYAGGSIEMPQLETVLGGAVTFDVVGNIGAVQETRIDVPRLTSFKGYFRYNVGGAVSSSGFHVNDDGIIHSPRLHTIDTGHVTLGHRGVMTTSDVTVLAGTVTLSGGNYVGIPSLTLADTGSIQGYGTFNGDVINGGLLNPDHPSSVYPALTINGNLIQQDTGTLLFDLAGTIASITHDQLDVTGQVTLDGTLKAKLANGYPGNLTQ